MPVFFKLLDLFYNHSNILLLRLIFSLCFTEIRYFEVHNIV